MGHFISLKLDGVDCNKDAIGARVTVWVSGRQLVQTVEAGSGYLAQSSKRLHFGLGDATAIDRIEVRWPGGKTETLPQASVGYHYRYAQASGRMESRPATSVPIPPPLPEFDAPVKAAAEGGNGIVLRQPFPLPEDWLDDELQEGQFELVTFWAQWCGICRGELTEFGKHKERLKQAGIRLIPLNLDSEDDRDQARNLAEEFGLGTPFRSLSQPQATLVDALLRSALDIHDKFSLPMSLLVDSKGKVIVIYNGPTSIDEVVRDRQALASDSPSVSPGSSQRWVTAEVRRYNDVADELKKARLLDWARFYLKLDRQAKGQ